jgi:hypothetical protein
MTTTPADRDIVIWGVTRSGRAFRPRDWADRLAGLTSAFGADQRLTYSPYVQPMTLHGMRALLVEHRLATVSPRLHQFLVNFARDNDLVTELVSDAPGTVQSLKPPEPHRGEPREPV